jgi:hypothetical protein
LAVFKINYKCHPFRLRLWICPIKYH